MSARYPASGPLKLPERLSGVHGASSGVMKLCGSVTKKACPGRAIGKKLEIPAMTALDSYRQSPPCMETVSAGTVDSGGKRKRKTVAA